MSSQTIAEPSRDSRLSSLDRGARPKNTRTLWTLCTLWKNSNDSDMFREYGGPYSLGQKSYSLNAQRNHVQVDRTLRMRLLTAHRPQVSSGAWDVMAPRPVLSSPVAQ
jgi:hypothetical protein